MAVAKTATMPTSSVLDTQPCGDMLFLSQGWCDLNVVLQAWNACCSLLLTRLPVARCSRHPSQCGLGSVTELLAVAVAVSELCVCVRGVYFFFHAANTDKNITLCLQGVIGVTVLFFL